MWNRVPSKSRKEETHDQQTPSASDLPQVPTVRTTLPEEDDVVRPSASIAPSQLNVTGDATVPSHRTTKSVEDLPVTQTRISNQLRLEPRKFHFSRTTTSARNTSVLHGGIQKARKKQRKSLAVFVEQINVSEEPRHRGATTSDLEGRQSDIGKGLPRPSAELSRPRKRPLASPAERKWRTQTWKQPPKDSVREVPAVVRVPGNDSPPDSLFLASQLQQFAYDVSRAETGVHHWHQKTSAKVKPKPPKPRPPKAESDTLGDSLHERTDAMDLSGTQGEDSENFVFDVYVRREEHLDEVASAGTQDAMLKAMDPDRVGVLVIADEDQETWELYGAEDQSSDDHWNSDEEDENGQYCPPGCGHRGPLG